MNENLNLVEILKDCPEGTKLYSLVHGCVEFCRVKEDMDYPIRVRIIGCNYTTGLTKDGKIFYDVPGECTLFPSKEQRDWSKFKVNKPKFDPTTFMPFDRVLCRCKNIDIVWSCDFFSHLKDRIYVCSGCMSNYVIPYNDDTKHLVGTTKEAPEYYRYWED